MQIQYVLALVHSPLNQDLEAVLGRENVLRITLESHTWEALIDSTSEKKIGGDLPVDECFSSAFAFIDRALGSNKKILIHCSAGENRSPSIVMAYLISRIGMPFCKAMEYMLQKYPQMRLSDSIRQGLAKYASPL